MRIDDSGPHAPLTLPSTVAPRFFALRLVLACVRDKAKMLVAAPVTRVGFQMSYEDCFDAPLNAGRLRGARANLIGSEPRAAEIPSAMEMNVNAAALNTTRTSVFRLGAHWVAPDTNEIDGSRVDAKAMDVLIAMVAASPGVISPAQLMDRVWSRVVVGDNVVHQAIATLRRALGDDARAPRYVQSIPKRGYRLIANVAHPAADNVVCIASASNEVTTRNANSLDVLAANETVAFRAPATRYLLAVLAFDNLSGDAELDYFSDGLSDEIRDTVSRAGNLRVIGRASSLQFRGSDKAAARIAAQLHATHVLDGSVRRSGARVRISTELVECASEVSVWCRRFDRDLSDIFALQDEIAGAVAQTLSVGSQ